MISKVLGNSFCTFILLFVSIRVASLQLKACKRFKRSKYQTLLMSDTEDAFGAPVGPLPTVSSKINFDDETPKNVKYDLWIVGTGTLGMMALKQYRNKYPNAKIIAETATLRSHKDIESMGATPQLRSNRSQADYEVAKNVLICIPPSAAKSENKTGEYVDEVSCGCTLWAGPLGGGNLVFTSSIGVYGEAGGNVVDENFRVDTRSAKSSILLAAEEAVLSRQGCVIRLAGLYTTTRGPHSYWLNTKKVDGPRDGFLNMLHYEDAASVSVRALETGQERRVYLACDDEPVTRREICDAAVRSGLFPEASPVVFTIEGSGISKICDDSITRSELDWKPKYTNFAHTMVTLTKGEPYDFQRPLMKPNRSKASQVKGELEELGLWTPGAEDDSDLLIL